VRLPGERALQTYASLFLPAAATHQFLPSTFHSKPPTLVHRTANDALRPRPPPSRAVGGTLSRKICLPVVPPPFAGRLPWVEPTGRWDWSWGAVVLSARRYARRADVPNGARGLFSSRRRCRRFPHLSVRYVSRPFAFLVDNPRSPVVWARHRGKMHGGQLPVISICTSVSPFRLCDGVPSGRTVVGC
jgi:hypothetical protein